MYRFFPPHPSAWKKQSSFFLSSALKNHPWRLLFLSILGSDKYIFRWLWARPDSSGSKGQPWQTTRQNVRPYFSPSITLAKLRLHERVYGITYNTSASRHAGRPGTQLAIPRLELLTEQRLVLPGICVVDSLNMRVIDGKLPRCAHRGDGQSKISLPPE